MENIDSFFIEPSDNQYGILEEENQGQNYRFYVYDYDNNEALEWFNTWIEAENYLNLIEE